MSAEVQTATGNCPEHGRVEATRPIPRTSFPFVVSMTRRAMAARRPFRCPSCGAPIDTGRHDPP